MSDPRAILHQLADAIGDVVEQSTEASKWYHQGSSPLHKTTYLRLARSGRFESFKVGSRVLVRRADIDAYIEMHPVEAHTAAPELNADQTVTELLNSVGVRRTG